MSDSSVAVRDADGTVQQVANWTFTDGGGNSVKGQRVFDALAVGTWGYTAGTSGTATLTGGKRVREITCIATSAATLTINGGDTITVPADVGLTLPINGLLEDPTLVFTGTASYVVQHVS